MADDDDEWVLLKCDADWHGLEPCEYPTKVRKRDVRPGLVCPFHGPAYVDTAGLINPDRPKDWCVDCDGWGTTWEQGELYECWFCMGTGRKHYDHDQEADDMGNELPADALRRPPDRIEELGPPPRPRKEKPGDPSPHLPPPEPGKPRKWPREATDEELAAANGRLKAEVRKYYPGAD
jgi:hypothetical protein